MEKLETVFLTAAGVGGATVVGAVLGFIFGGLSERMSGVIMGVASGVMLAASFLGLLIPSLELGGGFSVLVCALGLFIGGACIDVIDRAMARLDGLPTLIDGAVSGEQKMRRVKLLVLAIAIHNIPEGIAAGVGFGSGEGADAILIAGAIALQNVPEGMVIIAPMLSVGVKRWRAFLYASLTGVVEVVGTLVGYLAVSAVERLLPFALAFAGGAMLYVVADEMIPEARLGGERSATYSILLGVMLMLLIGELLA